MTLCCWVTVEIIRVYDNFAFLRYMWFNPSLLGLVRIVQGVLRLGVITSKLWKIICEGEYSTVWKNFSGKGCVIGVYYHNSLMVAYSALRNLACWSIFSKVHLLTKSTRFSQSLCVWFSQLHPGHIYYRWPGYISDFTWYTLYLLDIPWLPQINPFLQFL